MTTARDFIIQTVDRFKEKHEASDREIGLGAVGDHKLIPRIRRGESVTLASIEKLERYLRDYVSEAPQ